MSAARTRLLLIEDNPGDSRLIRELLRGVAEVDLQVAERLAAGLTHLATRPPDVVLLDLGLPDSRGLETLRAARAAAPGMPLVVLTGQDDEATGLQAIQEGAQDYLVKGRVDALVLRRALRYAIERKRMEEVVRENEARFRRLFDLSPVGAVIVGLDYRFLRCNEAFCRFLGYEEQDLLQKTFQEVTHPEDLEIGKAEINAILAGTLEVGRVEKRYLHRCGRLVPGDVNIRLLRDAAGSPIHFVTVIQDITERKRAAEVLHAEHDRLRAVLAAAPVAILVIDEREEIVQTNPAAERLFGRAGADPGARCGDLIGCAHRLDDPRGCGAGPSCPGCLLYGAVRESLGGLAVNGREVEFELQRDGRSEHRWLVANAEPFLLDGKRAAVLAVQDRTEQRRAQADLAQAGRLASMGLLAAGVAHEINNPLAYVLFNREVLGRELPRLREPERVRDLPWIDELVRGAGEALEGTRRIRDIVRDLGTFSRTEPADVGAADLNYAVECAANMASNEIRFRARLVKELGRVPFVLGSEGRLAQVFLNLLVNACHAIGEGAVDQNEIRVRTWAEGAWVLAEVRDTGPGLAPEILEQIFEPFTTTKPAGAGTGLGLSICRNIVEGFGGTIVAASEAGEGARFTLRLPAGPPAAAEPLAAPAEVPGPAVRGRILVVDDEPMIRDIVARMLEADHEVLIAASGQEAQVLLVADQAFDLILCDFMMTPVSGMELHGWLTETYPALADRVIFMTGGAFTPRAQEYLARVGNRKVEKPFEGESLRRLVGERVLAAKSRAGGGGRA